MKRVLPFLLIVIAVCASYAPAVRDGFVWDDTALILRDPLIRSPKLIAEGFQHFLFTDATASDFYRPLQRLSYTFEYAAFGFIPAAFHLTSVVCHAAAAIALLLFSRELLRSCGAIERRRDTLALIAALVWAIHPIQSSAVVYISGRADPLAATFGFLALYVSLRSFRAGTATRVWSLAALSVLLLTASALSKESGLIFLALYLLLVMSLKKTRALAAVGVIAIVATTYLSLRLPAEHIKPPAPHALPLLVRPILAARAIAEYTSLLVVPVNLRMERDVETYPSGFGEESITGASLRELQTLAGVVVLSGIVYWLLRERTRDRAAFLSLCCGAASFLPISGIVPLNANLAEHWLYVPSAFLFLSAAVATSRPLTCRHGVLFGRIALRAATVWMVCLSSRTFLRTFDWKNERTFLERTIADGGNSARMFVNLARIDIEDGRLDLAEGHLATALAKTPEQPFAVICRAGLAIRQRDFATARKLLGRATHMPLVEARAHEMLAVLEFHETGRTNLLRMRLAARSGAGEWDIEKRYVKLLFESGAREAALRELRACLQTQWYRADSWKLAAQLAAQSGNQEAAAAALACAHAYDIRLPEGAFSL